MLLTGDGIEILDEGQCRSLLRQHDIGRVGITIGALPAIFPVNYVVDGDAVVFRTDPGTKLSAALHKAVVAFEVDDVDSTRTAGWSVLLVTTATEVTDPAEISRLGTLPIPVPVGIERSHFVRLPIGTGIDFVSGRRFGPASLFGAAQARTPDPRKQ